MVFWQPISAIAHKEFHDNCRNYWLILMTIIFSILSVCTLFAHGLFQGEAMLGSSVQVLSTLVLLSVFMVPLAAILLSYDAFIGEVEAGTLLLLLTYPLSRQQLLLGKFLGHASVLLLACLLGFLPSLGYLMIQQELTTWAQWLPSLHFLISAWLLGLVFLGFGYAISLFSREKTMALATGLFIWFVMVLMYDLGVLLLLDQLADQLSRQALNLLIMMNPTSLFRALNVLSQPELNVLLQGQNVQSSKSVLMILLQSGFQLPWMYAGFGFGLLVLLSFNCHLLRRQWR